ncbi:MAG: hypothetical protein ACQEV6_17245 [Pseudomonadota bacterium]
MIDKNNLLVDKVDVDLLEQGYQDYLASDIWYCIDDTALQVDNHTQKPIIDSDGKAKNIVFNFDISQAYKGLSVESELAIKLYILNKSRLVDGQLYSKRSTLENLRAMWRYVAEACESCGFETLSEINLNTLEQFVQGLVVRVKGLSNLGPRKNVDPCIRASGTFEATISMIHQMALDKDFYLLPDAPSCEFDRDDCYEMVRPIVQKRLNWKEWRAGETLGTFPLELTLLLLQEGIIWLESTEARTLIAFVQAVEEYAVANNLNVPAQLRNVINKSVGPEWKIDDQGVYKVGKAKGPKASFQEPVKRYASDFKKPPVGYVLQALIREKYRQLGGDPKEMDIPQSSGVATDRIRRASVKALCMVSILSGARISEIASLKKNAFEVRQDGKSATFKSRIKKTNNNIETVRPISIHAENFAWIPIMLSRPGLTHEKGDAAALFQVCVPWRGAPLDCLKFSDTRFGVQEESYRVLEELVSDFDRAEHAITSHRFRHTWAELALRRFDGAVLEAVRNYFRHWYGSSFTMAYAGNKVKADLPEISRGYMRELVHRAASGREEFFGPSGRYLLKRVQEMGVLTAEGIERLLDEYDVIDVHEYSYCFMPKQHKSLAKCFDKATSSPLYGNAKWEHCGGCVGRFALHNHRDKIMRIGMREQELLNTKEGLGLSSLTRLSKKIIKQCEAALEDFEKRIPLVSVPTQEES